MPKDIPPDKSSTMLSIIQYWGVRGLSDRSIASKCGFTLSKFYDVLELEQHKVKVFKEALEIARATFEADRVIIKDEIMNDPETSTGLKYKIVREDLKTLEAWAPATRAIKLMVEDARTVIEFDSLSEKEQQDIINRTKDSGINTSELDRPVEEE